jgi:hypothetical protein
VSILIPDLTIEAGVSRALRAVRDTDATHEEAVALGVEAFRQMDEAAMLARVLLVMEMWSMLHRAIEANGELVAMLTEIPLHHLLSWVKDMKPPPEVYALSLKASMRAERKLLAEMRAGE